MGSKHYSRILLIVVSYCTVSLIGYCKISRESLHKFNVFWTFFFFHFPENTFTGVLEFNIVVESRTLKILLLKPLKHALKSTYLDLKIS